VSVAAAFTGRPLIRSSVVTAAVATAVAAALDALFVGRKSFWEDEGSSWAFAQGSLSNLKHAVLHVDPNMTLYYGLLHLWLHVADSEGAIRALSGIFAVLTVPVIYLLGDRLFGPIAGALAAITFAVNAFVVEYAQEARSYSLVTLLVTLSSYFFVSELLHPSRWTRAAYVATSVLAMYAHFFAIWILLVQLLTLLFFRRDVLLTRRWLSVVAAIGLGYLPAAAQIARFGHANIGWIPRPTLRTLVHTSARLAGGHWALLLLALASAAFLGRSALSRTAPRWRIGFVLMWLLLPVLSSFVLSFVETMFYPAYLIVSVPAVALVVGGGLAALAERGGLERATAVVLLVAILALSGLQLHQWYSTALKEDWRDATRYVLSHEHPGDHVVFYVPHGQNPFDYYAHLSRNPGPSFSDLADGPRSGRRLWLVRLHEPTNSPVVRGFGRRLAAAGYRLISARVFSPLRAQLGVSLYARRG
jgi:mannosyltransferase